jgi:hypothetical protein
MGPWLGFTEGTDRRRPNLARGLTGGEGQVRGNVQGLTAVSGMAGVEAERGCGGVSTAKPSGRGGAPRAAAVFRWLGCRRAVKKLLGSFYGMMWCCWCPWLGLRGSVAECRRRGRAAAKLELTDAVGDDTWVRESEIGWVSELQGVATVLLEHWIAGGRRCGRLMTAARGCGGGPVRCGGQDREK